MQIQVLGPLRVEDGGESYVLGGPKQRAVLALLVAEAGRPVSTDALIMGVYGEDADPGSRRSLQTYISSLRGSLGRVIRHESQTYTLDIDPRTIDAVRFEREIERARTVADDSVSAQMLREALSLWRGAPYADVDAPITLRSEIARLEELHAGALEARVELDLIAGRHHELLAELEDLASTYPVRESLRAHQMLALYRCGRQADALRAYRQARTFLRDQFGLEPSVELQSLETRILQQDPALDFRPRPTFRPAPARYTKLFGRSKEIAAVSELLSEHRIVTITGTGGIGKSSLAAEVAHSLSASMATAFVPVDTQDRRDIVALIFEAIGIQTSTDADRVGALSGILSTRPTILILDGCERIINEIAGPISEILERSASTRILVTSREGLFVAGEQRFLLGPLEYGQDSPSNQLFEDRAGISHSDLEATSLSMVSDIGTQLAGMPLALELAAARHRTLPLEDIVNQLDRQADLLSSERGPQQRHLSMAAALDWSYDLLDSPSQTAFRRLAVFRGEIPPEAGAAVLETVDPTDQLRTLADASLLVPPENDIGFRILEPIRQYAWRHLKRSGELDTTLLRHAEWILDLCADIRHESNSGSTSEALAMIRTHGAEMETSARWALDSGRPGIAMAIVVAVGRRWRLLFDPRQLCETGTRAIEDPSAPTGDLLLQAMAHTALMSMETDPDTAMELVERLRPMGEETNDPETLFDVANALAIVPRNSAVHPLGRDQLISVLAEWDRAIGYATALGWPSEPRLYNRAVILQDLGRHDEAEAALREIAAWADDSRPLERGRALHALARVEAYGGSLDTAIDMATQAARLLVDAGDLNFAAEAQYKRAVALYLSNRPEEAARALDVVDQYHTLIGLPASSDENPALVAAVAAGLGNWDTFRDLMGGWISHAPPLDNEPVWEMYLVGDASRTTQLGLLMYPTARWLASTGREREAARIVAAASIAFESMEFDGWEQIGETERFASLATGLRNVPAGDPLSTLDEIYAFIVACVQRPA